MPVYKATTRGIEIDVSPQFLPDRSDPDRGYYVWAYTIGISNHGSEPVTLRTRHWQITDAAGRMQEVKGAGVVGEEPRLEPGERFEYTSGCPLTTPSGFMAGSYAMQVDSGETFDVTIPTFSLDLPSAAASLN